jgi:hypothetical protein
MARTENEFNRIETLADRSKEFSLAHWENNLDHSALDDFFAEDSSEEASPLHQSYSDTMSGEGNETDVIGLAISNALAS